MQRELLARGALDVIVTACDCLGPCFDGPNAVVYPDGVWYAGLAPADAPALADHLVDGPIAGDALSSKISDRPGAADSGSGSGNSGRADGA